MATAGTQASNAAAAAGLNPSRQAQQVDGTTAAAAVPRASTPRLQLLQDFQAASNRDVDRDAAVHAIQLRCLAEIYCSKDKTSGLPMAGAPRAMLEGTRESRVDKLLKMPVEQLMSDVQAHPENYHRSDLVDVAMHHLAKACGADMDALKAGAHAAGQWEGVHAVVGRVAMAAFSVTSSVVTLVPGELLAEGAEKAFKSAMRHLPQNLVNPVVTALPRIVTDVKNTFKREGGQIALTANIDKGPNMGQVAKNIRAERKKLAQEVARVDSAHGTDAHAADGLGKSMQDTFTAANTQYKSRIGNDRSQTYSKGWGGVVNGVAAGAAVISVVPSGFGQIAGPAIMVACVPAQWAAGYADEQVKQPYNLRAVAKWGNEALMEPQVDVVDFRELRPDQISKKALRGMLTTQPELRVAALREVYEDMLGEFARQRVVLQKDRDRANARGDTAKAMKRQNQLNDINDERNGLLRDARRMESMDPQQWAAISPKSLLGRCMDDVGELESATLKARFHKPGEVTSQILQRVVQNNAGGISSTEMMPVAEAMNIAPDLRLHDAAGEAVSHHQDVGGHAVPAIESDAARAQIGTGVTGGAAFTAATGRVRVDKGSNKTDFGKLPEKSKLRDSGPAEEWKLDIGGRSVDLTKTGGYHKLAVRKRDITKQLAKAGGKGIANLLTGPANLGRAAYERHRAKGVMRDGLAALEKGGYDKLDNRPDAPRKETLAGLRDQFMDYAVVRGPNYVPPGTAVTTDAATPVVQPTITPTLTPTIPPTVASTVATAAQTTPTDNANTAITPHQPAEPQRTPGNRIIPPRQAEPGRSGMTTPQNTLSHIADSNTSAASSSTPLAPPLATHQRRPTRTTTGGQIPPRLPIKATSEAALQAQKRSRQAAADTDTDINPSRTAIASNHPLNGDEAEPKNFSRPFKPKTANATTPTEATTTPPRDAASGQAASTNPAAQTPALMTRGGRIIPPRAASLQAQHAQMSTPLNTPQDAQPSTSSAEQTPNPLDPRRQG